MGPGDSRKAERAQHRSQLPGQQHFPPVEAVSHVPGRKGEREHRQHLCEPHKAQRQRHSGAFVQLPPDGNVLHLIADVGDEAPHHEQPVVAESQRDIGVVPRW